MSRPFVSMFQVQELSFREMVYFQTPWVGEYKGLQKSIFHLEAGNDYNIHFGYPSSATDSAKVLSVISEDH